MEAYEPNGRATVAIVDAKVDGLKDLIRAEFKAVGRRLDELSALEPRVRTLELASEPLTDRLRETSERVDDLTATVEGLEKQSVTGAQVKTALAFDRDERESRQIAAFSRKEKYIGLGIGILLALLNIAQAIQNL